MSTKKSLPVDNVKIIAIVALSNYVVAGSNPPLEHGVQDFAQLKRKYVQKVKIAFIIEIAFPIKQIISKQLPFSAYVCNAA